MAQFEEPVAENVPEAHMIELVSDSPKQKLPAGQRMHADDPVEGWNFPLEQELQDGLPAGLKVPAEQGDPAVRPDVAQ